MRFLLVSDVHLDAPFTWAGPELARSRRRAIRTALQHACEVAQERQVDAFLVAGDLYEHDRFSPDTTEFLRATFADIDLPIYLTPGNHDWFGPHSIYQQVDWTPNVHIFTEDQLTPVELEDGFTLWGAAHRAPANTNGFLDHFSVDRGGINVALFHGSEQGDFSWQESGKAPHAPFTAAQVPAAGLHHALVGHFHRPTDGQWHTYPGNLEPLSFGEDGIRGAVLVEFAQDGALTRTHIPVSDSQVHDVFVDLTGITNSSEMRSRVEQVVDPLRGLVRATLSGEVPPESDVRAADLVGIGTHLDAFLPRLGRITFAYDFDSLEQEPTVRGQFVRDVRAAELDDDTRRRVLITGLRALDGRADDLEVH